MSIYSLVTISGTQVDDIITCDVDKSLGENNSSSSFTIQLDNFRGYNKNNYELGNEVKVYAAVGSSLPYAYTYSSENYSNLGSTLIGSQLLGSSVTSNYDSGLVAYWKMNDVIGSTVTAYIGSNLLASGIANGSNVGIIGSCWSTGSQAGVGVGRISATDNTLYLGTSGVTTISLWIKTNKINTTEGAFIINKPNNYTDGNANDWAIYEGANGSLACWTYNANTRQQLECGSSDLLWNGSWNHIGWQFGISGMKLWINGSNWMTATGSTQNAGAGVNQPMTIGANFRQTGGIWQSFYSGLIDEVRIYNYPVSNSTMAAIYNSGVPSEYASGVATVTNFYFNDYSNTLSGTYITQNGSSIIGSQLFNVGSYLTTSGTYDTGLMAYYKLNESGGTTAYDYTGSNNGFISGATVGQTGKLGNCFLFDNTSECVLLGSYSGIPRAYNKAVTFSAWVKSIGSRASYCEAISAFGGAANLFESTLGINSNYQFVMGFNKKNVAAYEATSPTYVTSGVWYHIAGTFNGTSSASGILLYVNGSAVANATWGGGAISDGTGSVCIGNNQGNGGNYFNGYVDDARIYNYALPLGSIQAIFNNGSPLEYPGEIYSASGGTPVYDYANVYTGSVTNIGSYSIGSQLINGSYFNNYDYLYNGSYSYIGSNISGLLFTGILEDVKFDGKGLKEKLVLTGRDYSARLMDRTVEPEVYTNLPAGSIVLDIINKYTTDIDNSLIGIGSGATVDRISFNHMPVFDAIKKLADLSNYSFYVDIDKKLHFEPSSSESSGYTFDNTNVLQASFKEQRDTLFNKVWVYGDRYLDGYKETFKAGSPLNGSVFSLIYNPHNTEITVNGSTIQPGAIEGITTTPGSTVKYLVNYNDKKITFTSGTSQGNNVPASGASVVVNYQRSLPVVKVGDNETSKAQYGERVKVIIDKDIKDPTTAETLMQRELEKSSEPKVEGNLKIKGVVNITPGQTCIVDMPNHNVNNETYDILECNYSFNKSNNLSEDVLKIKVNEKLPDVTDTMKDMLNALRKLQGGDISTSDLITRYQYEAGSLSIKSVYDRVQTKSISGSTLIWGNNAYGIWNSFYWGNTNNNPIVDYYVNHYGNLTENFTGSSFISYLSGCSLSNGSVVF